jgi:hypothetical protein
MINAYRFVVKHITREADNDVRSFFLMIDAYFNIISAVRLFVVLEYF